MRSNPDVSVCHESLIEKSVCVFIYVATPTEEILFIKSYSSTERANHSAGSPGGGASCSHSVDACLVDKVDVTLTKLWSLVKHLPRTLPPVRSASGAVKWTLK